tara:strand:- start:234 stop:677 length:444 start_codon:yes stop_codon:yes gene_type:complete
MKVNLMKTANGKLWPADEEDEIILKKIKVGEVYSCDIKLNQNWRLHKKIMGFFSFCCDHYYGDSEAHKDEYKFKYVRKKLTVIAGYFIQVWSRDGSSFELVPVSLSYGSMPPEERGIFYKKITDAALKRVFDRTTDDEILKKLISWF